MVLKSSKEMAMDKMTESPSHTTSRAIHAIKQVEKAKTEGKAIGWMKKDHQQKDKTEERPTCIPPDSCCQSPAGIHGEGEVIDKAQALLAETG